MVPDLISDTIDYKLTFLPAIHARFQIAELMSALIQSARFLISSGQREFSRLMLK